MAKFTVGSSVLDKVHVFPPQSVIRAVVGVLTHEEQALRLQQPAGIGQRPRPMGM